jgi:uncharacterized membrane protein
MRDLHDSDSAVEPATKTQVLSLDPNLAGTLAYAPFFVGLVSSIVWVATEPKSNKFVRFHAFQSLAFFVASVAVSVVTSILGAFLGVLGGFLSMVVGLGLFAVMIVCMVKAWKNEMFKLPVLGDFVEQKFLA